MDVTMMYSHKSECWRVTARSKMFVATVRGEDFGSHRSLPPTMSTMTWGRRAWTSPKSKVLIVLAVYNITTIYFHLAEEGFGFGVR